MSDADRTTALADALIEGVRSRQSQESGGGVEPAALLEVGIGERTGIAATLLDRGIAVSAVDVVARAVPDGMAFQRADVTELDAAEFEGIDGVYALRAPPELHRPIADLARTLDVPAAFTTLGGDPPIVPVRPEQLPGGETLYWVTD
ncbi:hypothetical protein L593_13965 [Salinarchaeum sp. Harcht-Bsk1]|uniref:UPF0146 family protein n=1 Tax=Salinarchaeum sp. Harcht-Bsk1 TaxID=1333523 RepID=UPI0003423CFA|nr:UPF0146 family protein [Salinarchaeum sp. Harcht-Bsk1]AGN02732.1 hypothetical protein L593_13965 [Salinarchaeum sp. Harcht-Bsk1]